MPSTRTELKEYALRALGKPVVQINVDDAQLEDRIDEALSFFHLYHYEGMERTYLKHQITATDITNQYISVPDWVFGVKRVLNVPQIAAPSSSSLFSVEFQLVVQNLADLNSIDLIGYDITRRYISMLDQMMNGYVQFEFNRIGGKLYLELSKSKLVENNYLVIECYRAIDPTTHNKIWDEPWLKEYTIALFKRQWATNLKKYQGIQLPGGVTIDGQTLYIEALQEIERLEADLMEKQAPLGFMVG